MDMHQLKLYHPSVQHVSMFQEASRSISSQSGAVVVVVEVHEPRCYHIPEAH